MSEELMTMTRTRNRAKRADVFRIFQALQEALELQNAEAEDDEDEFTKFRGTDGLVKFKDGQSDAVIADRLGVADTTVRDIRRENFGNLPGGFGGEGGGRSGLRTLVEDLAARVACIEQHLGLESEEEKED